MKYTFQKLLTIKPLAVTMLVCSTFALASAQEVCDNGIDDDGDGLIDLKDDECACNGIDIYYPSSLFPNPSFEESVCPAGPGAVDCAIGWMQPSDGTPDYIEACEFVSPILPAPPCPIPDGTKSFGFLFSNLDQFVRREYVGTCLTSNLEAGTTYRLSFFLGFLGDTDNQFKSRPMNLTVYGNMDCESMPFDGFGCPENAPLLDKWESIESIYVEGGYEWKQHVIEFTPQKNYAAVILGPPCEPISGLNYYFLDNLVLARRDAFTRDIIEVESGNACEGDLVLSIPELENIDIQWYHDSVAIPGATSNTYSVPPGNDGEGTYTVRLVNPVGCTVTESFELDFEIPEVEISGPEGLCPGENAILTTNYSTGSFAWSTGAEGPELSISSGGAYDLTYTNEYGCETTDEILVDSYPGIDFDLEVVNESIPNAGDGSITVNFNSAVENPVFDWSNGGWGNALAGLSEGVYCVTITSNGRCQAEACAEVFIDFYPMAIELFSDSVSCNGGRDGSTRVEVNGGKAPYDIAWGPKTGSQRGAYAGALEAGTYQVTVTDSIGTALTGSVEVEEPAPITATAEVENVSCHGMNDGSIRISEVSGGNGGYQYNWTDQVRGPERSGLSPDNYFLRIVDRNNCIFNGSYDILEPDPLQAGLDLRPEDCEGAGNGRISVTDISGGTGEYAVYFEHNLVGDRRVFEGLTGDRNYHIEIKDENNCSWSESVQPGIDRVFTIDIGADTLVREGTELEITASGNDAISAYLWERSDRPHTPCPGCESMHIRVMEEVEILLRAENELGCIAEDSKWIEVYEPYKAYFPNAFSPNGDGVNDYFVIYNHQKIDRIVSVEIFNSWGQKIFELRDHTPINEPEIWDGITGGNTLDNGVFVVIAQIEFIDGSVINYKGELSIIR